MTGFRIVADDPVPIHDRLVRVAVPQQVAYDFDRMAAVTKQILRKLGCEACHSGWDIRFQLHRDFLVNEEGRVSEVSAIPITLP